MLYIQILEQGLIPLLLMISSGRKYYSDVACELYPEVEVRQCAVLLLTHTQIYLCKLAVNSNTTSTSNTTASEPSSIIKPPNTSTKLLPKVSSKSPNANNQTLRPRAVDSSYERVYHTLISSNNLKLKLNLFIGIIYSVLLTFDSWSWCDEHMMAMLEYRKLMATGRRVNRYCNPLYRYV